MMVAHYLSLQLLSLLCFRFTASVSDFCSVAAPPAVVPLQMPVTHALDDTLPIHGLWSVASCRDAFTLASVPTHQFHGDSSDSVVSFSATFHRSSPSHSPRYLLAWFFLTPPSSFWLDSSVSFLAAFMDLNDFLSQDVVAVSSAGNNIEFRTPGPSSTRLGQFDNRSLSHSTRSTMLAVRCKQATLSATTTRNSNGISLQWFSFARYFVDRIRQSGFSAVLQSDFFSIAGDLD